MNNSKAGFYSLILGLGVLASLMNYFNGVLATYSGLYLSGLMVHLIGLGPALLLFLMLDWNKREKWGKTFAGSKHLFTAGFLGSVMLILCAFCINRTGVFITSLAITVGQFILSLVIDLKGYFGFPKIRLNTAKLVAVGLIVAGSIMISI